MPLPMWYSFLLALTTGLVAVIPILALAFFCFYPRQPMVVGRLRLQGLLPAKRKALARLVWNGARNEFTQGAVGRYIASPSVAEHISRSLCNALEQELDRLADSAPNLLRGILKERLAPAFLKRLEEVVQRKLPGMVTEISESLLSDKHLDNAVPESVERLLKEGLETEARNIACRILPVILAGAAAFGFLVGLFQFFLIQGIFTR